ncbi:MAG: hypothetical protein ABI912_08435 [Actinomycetota bacterium]
MTTAALPATRTRTRPAGVRLVQLHMVSRRIPNAVTALAACALVLRLGLELDWIKGTGANAQQMLLLIETAAATVIAIAARNPFGESERAAGRWLPYLRLGSALAMTAIAATLLAAGSAAAQLPGGEAAAFRNMAGLTGIGLLSALLLGGGLAWVGPLAYAAVAEFTISAGWQTPWIWPGRPAHDVGAALCAGLAFALGAALIAVLGPRELNRG